MQLYYDKSIITLEHEGKFFIYSPVNHVRMSVNEYSDFLVKQILNAEGVVNTEQIGAAFQDKYNVSLKPEDIMEQIERLLKMEIFFRSPEEIVQAKERVIGRYKMVDKVPDLVYFLLTYRCNYDCFYCYLRDAHKDVQELSAEQWVKITESLMQMGVKNFCITGGEPLVRDDLVDILKGFKKGKSSVTMLTNGSLLKDKLEVIDPLVDFMVISLDSINEEVHGVNRSRYGFQDILDVIKYYGKHSPNKIKVRAVVTKNNMEEMNEYTKIINSYGIRTIRTLVNPLSLDELDIVPELAGKMEMDEDRIADLSFGMKYRKCGACNTTISLNPAGDIMPCQAVMQPEFKMANILDENWFETFLRSETRQQFLGLNLDKMEKCKDCAWRYLCGGICPAMAYGLYGNFTSHVECFCDFLKERAMATLTSAPGIWQDA